ncbi:MAG: mannose-1-phosphate guanylyltransferase/mannose-6-phosphate isomerase [Candidatus Gastranaerophilales bacterium]|nr:mannose-1-phosphate guanylyltransferase/mannose-6-phosphate isomerase [Candidatus Gastranaerophilales bacterium]
MKNTNIYGVILAGGSGSRLWPLSRAEYPKQLLKLLNQDTSLFQETFLRLAKIAPKKNIITITNAKQASDIKIQLGEMDAFENPILSEPLGKNTAPAIALSTVYIKENMTKNDDDPIIIVAPSDHLIKNCIAFADTVKKGVSLAQAGYIVTFGIVPTHLDTGFGYIETTKTNDIQAISPSAFYVNQFREKPDLETAKEYIEKGSFYWNGGIFMFKASTLLDEMSVHANDIISVLNDSEISTEATTINFDDYEKMPNISIDYAVMEKSKKIALLPLNCGWNDLGSWQAIYDVAAKDANNNSISGNVINIDSENTLIYGTSDKLVATIGLKDVVIIETEDAILACNKNQTQDVKKVFDQLKQKNHAAYRIHRTVYRPWGHYTYMGEEKDYLIKTICVTPKSSLSLQLHHHRSEHWTVLSGNAIVQVGEEKFNLSSGESIDIPIKTKHRLENIGDEDLKIIEVQKGDYLSEDDIIRFQDEYGRADLISENA